LPGLPLQVPERHFAKRSFLRLLEYADHPIARSRESFASLIRCATEAWGFTIGATITKLYAEWQTK
jgi:hypothetical protein